MTNLTLVIGNKNYSSWSLRPWLAMRQFGIDFDEIRIPLYTPESQSPLKQYSPSGKVPVLIHDAVKIWDSLAICEYLAEQFPMVALWPFDLTARAIARSISAEMHSGFQALRHQMPMNCRARLQGKEITPDVQVDINRIITIWQECRGTKGVSQQGNFLFGKFTIADAMFAPVIIRFMTYGISLDPVSHDYAEAVLALPTLQEWLRAAEIEPEKIPAFDHG